MKMAKWFLRDNESGSVTVARTDGPNECNKMVIYEDKRIKFYILSDKNTSKSVAYRLDYFDKKRLRNATFNSFVYFSGTVSRDPSKLNLEILYEDQVVRLLLYEHASKHKDYLLIGRWRTEVDSNTIDAVEEQES